MERSLRAAVRTMLERGWRPAGPVSESRLRSAERQLGVPLPEDYRAYLREAGDQPARAQNRWRGLWSVDELVSLNRHLPLFRSFAGLVGIANEGFLVTALDYRGGLPPRVVSLGLSSSDPGDIRIEAETFAGWLWRTLEDGP